MATAGARIVLSSSARGFRTAKPAPAAQPKVAPLNAMWARAAFDGLRQSSSTIHWLHTCNACGVSQTWPGMPRPMSPCRKRCLDLYCRVTYAALQWHLMQTDSSINGNVTLLLGQPQSRPMMPGWTALHPYDKQDHGQHLQQIGGLNSVPYLIGICCFVEC